MFRKDHHYLYVAAIDIGTTYSGFAFSSHKDFMKDPLKVYSPIWNSGHNISQKTATFILYDADDNFHSFGYEAENTYLELLEHSEEEALNWRAFYNFKMKLYEHEVYTGCSILFDTIIYFMTPSELCKFLLLWKMAEVLQVPVSSAIDYIHVVFEIYDVRIYTKITPSHSRIHTNLAESWQK